MEDYLAKCSARTVLVARIRRSAVIERRAEAHGGMEALSGRERRPHWNQCAVVEMAAAVLARGGALRSAAAAADDVRGGLLCRHHEDLPAAAFREASSAWQLCTY